MGLIDFKALYGDDTIMSGRGKITAKGIDFAESNYSDADGIPVHTQTVVSINTSGGTYIGGNAIIDGDFVSRDQAKNRIE